MRNRLCTRSRKPFANLHTQLGHFTGLRNQTSYSNNHRTKTEKKYEKSVRKISLLIVAHVCMYHMFIIVRVSCGCVAVFRQIKIVSVCIRKSPLTLLQSHNNNTHVTHMREYAVFEDVRAHRHNRRSCRRCRHWPR